MEPDWQEIYLQLYAFADQLLKHYTWFRGKKTDSFLMGKQPHDYAIDAIEKYLIDPEKYDSTKRSLAGYLKKHILRHVVFNDAVSLENKTSKQAPFTNPDRSDEDFVDLLLKHPDAGLDSEMDFDKIMAEIEAGVKDDPMASLIFEGTGRNGLKRRQIIEENNITDIDYDNGMKRLKTVLKQVIKKYEINEPKRVKKKEPKEKSI
jgi:hypothetical protein